MNESLVALEAERLAWSLETFPEATPVSSLRKLESEIKEIEADLVKGEPSPEEYADGLMCLFDSAGRAGVTVEQIIEAFSLKLIKNKNRVWKKNDDNSYSHVKPESHTEMIICSACEHIQTAIVEHTIPFNSYVHTCSKCGYIIMESEWLKVEDSVPYADELKRGVLGTLETWEPPKLSE